MAELLDKEVFKKFFIKLLEDENLRLEMQYDVFGVLERQGFDIDPEVRASLSRSMAKVSNVPDREKPKGNCSICGACSVCGLCRGGDAVVTTIAISPLFHVIVDHKL